MSYPLQCEVIAARGYDDLIEYRLTFGSTITCVVMELRLQTTITSQEGNPWLVRKEHSSFLCKACNSFVAPDDLCVSPEGHQ